MASIGPNPTIIRTSPAPADGEPTNPRRTTAQRSVSLRHPPSKKISASSSDPGASTSNNSPSSLIPLAGESSGESSNAERWFEKSNNEVRDNSASFTDNDPPFFLRNSSSSETPPERVSMLHHIPTDDRANSLPLRTGLLKLGGTDASSTDEFRSVIDDLTVENKKLKRKLKKYEKLHDSHMKDQKLFEVRIHGLPPEKRRELEETLRKFAADMDNTEANAFPSNRYANLWPTLKTKKTASSSISHQNTDSAYASMSTSGQGSSRLSGNDGMQKLTPKSNQASREQNIHNYLHDIPQGLLPQQNPTTLSERAKKKLVVRRMEQLFAGKGAGVGGHQQSIQQQEVSQSAARADKSAIEATGQRARMEGNREANIMQREAEDPADPQPSKPRMLQAEVNETGRSPARDQRPTRPLDLDPHRAQVPQDNIQYMRHLGFSPRDPRSSESPEEGHGWVYLNFLINMAQLHTINVTYDFVRKALSDYSDKFEVSNDGRKVRWRGGSSVTRTSSSGGGRSGEGTDNSTPEGQSPRKRVKLSHNDKARSFQTGVFGRNFQGRKTDIGKHAYTPMFHHRDSTDDSDDSSSGVEDDGMSSLFPTAPVAGDSSGMTSSGIRTSSGMLGPQKRRSQRNDDGPIIFYNNARFCTDLSGDRKAVANKSIPAYNTTSSVPIGRRRKGDDEPSETKGPLARASALPEPMDLEDNPIPESMELSFPQRSPIISDSDDAEQSPIELEVTGIGGVWPADNFAISVESRHTRLDQSSAPSVAPDLVPKSLPARFAHILHGSGAAKRSRSAVHKQFTVAHRKELAPSELPPPLGFMPYGEGSSGDDDESEVDEAMSEVPESLGDDHPEAAPQPVELHYLSDEEEDEDEDSSAGDSDGEVDFLATAREVNPEAVRQKEREYDANMAERLAEEIPAGSSAATAGGGSGFTSPVSGMNKEEHQRAAHGSRVQTANLDRLRTKELQKARDASNGAVNDAETSDVGP